MEPLTVRDLIDYWEQNEKNLDAPLIVGIIDYTGEWEDYPKHPTVTVDFLDSGECMLTISLDDKYTPETS